MPDGGVFRVVDLVAGGALEVLEEDEQLLLL